jgi:4-amino-4-deoxy-L-arabinose transferase-like glycosyltransferase
LENRRWRWSWPLLILIIGAAFRFHGLGYDTRFHPDEALFATFARNATINGDWLLHGPLDKPPLTIYAQALSMMLIGARPLENGVLTLDVHAGEFAARVPGTLASMLLMAVMYALAKRSYGHHVALIAILLTAFSPYLLAFSATSFTDNLMMLFITLALWLASRERWLWAGLWLALGYASKQQALLYIPLLIMIAGIQSIGDLKSPVKIISKLIRFSLPIFACFVLLAIWDSARMQESSIWTLALANNDPSGLIHVDAALPRLLIWVRYAGHFFGSAWLTALLLGMGLIGLVWKIGAVPFRRSARIDLILLVYSVGYFLLHWLVAVPTHDRYLLPLLPPLILLVARGLNQIQKNVSPRFRETENQRLFIFSVPLSLCISAILFFSSALNATQSRIDVGGDRGQHQGIDLLGAYLDSKPLGTIVYDHWLGWELGYYLGTWSNKRLTYYPNAGALTADAIIQTDPAPRYFPAPARAALDPWLGQLAAAGFKIALEYRTQYFVVYRLIPPPP